MCGRFALKAPASTITEIFDLDILPEVIPRYNVPPTTGVLSVVQEDDKRVAHEFRWGLIPSWAKDKKIGYRLINARGETASEKPAFRAAFKRRRCLILADGFYEWERLDKKTKLPHLIGLEGDKPFAMAGLWEKWTDKETDELVRSCTIVTTGPNELMAPIHNRMPVILPEDKWDTWLDPELQDKDVLNELLVPYPTEGMQERRVSTYVNSVKNQGPECQEPPGDDDPARRAD